MPICFTCCGIVLIFMLFGIFNSNFFATKLNFSLMLLYIVTQIFSFFIKDITISEISIIYFIPAIFSVLLFAVNITKINVIKTLTISVLIATLLLAIGFIDNAFIDFIESHILEVCLLLSLIVTVFSKNINESFLIIVWGFALFVFGILFKQTAVLDLTNVTLLNCITFSLLLTMFMQAIKKLTLNLLRRLTNAKTKKI